MKRSFLEDFRKRQIKLKRHIWKMGIRHVILFLLWPVLFLVLLLINYKTLSKLAMDNVGYRGDAQVMEFVLAFDDYLQDGARILNNAAEDVDKMMLLGTEDKVILSFLSRESHSLDGDLSRYSEGLYGYIRGEFMSGAGWEPAEGYIPTERPWYIDGLEAAGDTTYVAPYTDMMTGDRIMTIAKLLSDGESVLAMDFKVNHMQAITEEISKGYRDSTVCILDSDGTVVCHSIQGELDKNYLENQEGIGHAIAVKVLRDRILKFSLDYNNDSFLVFGRELGGGWYVLSITDANVMLSDVYKLTLFSAITSVIMLLFIVGAMISITKRRIVAEDINENLQSLSGIYVSMHKIDMIEDVYEEINCMVADISALLRGKKDPASVTMANVVSALTDELSREDILEFTDLSTLNDRMMNTDTVTREFLSIHKKWCRGRFIVVEREAQGRLKRVLWLVEIIDEEKRTRDQLLYLSETDRMTGLHNRGSGENKIRHQLLEGPGGMFLLMDVDNFKSVNDTYGHHVGDQVLIAIAECMKRVLRDQDIVMRLGGDEFAAFLPQVFDEDSGRTLIDRLLNAIRSIELAELGERRISVSIGATFCRTKEEHLTFDQIYKQADSCTYESKKHKGSYVSFYRKSLPRE